MATLLQFKYMFAFLIIVSIVIFFIIPQSSLSSFAQSSLQRVEINDNKQTYLNAKQMEHCWYQLFTTLFVPHKLYHTFSKSHDYLNCSKPDILLKNTDQMMQNATFSIIPSDSNNFNYRSLIKIRRIIMLLYTISEIQVDIQQYNTVLSTIAIIEHQYISNYRNNYTIFNIHPPRSAGSSLCRWFKRAKRQQLSSENRAYFVYQRAVITDPKPLKNCNAWDGGQFTRYSFEAKPCNEQYTNHNLTIFGRESPLYPNRNIYGYKHPLLCDEFVYIFAFRSPIERIISWAKTDTRFEIGDKETKWMVVKGKDFDLMLPNFYSSLFDYKINKEQNEIIKFSNETREVRISSRFKYLRSYSSNAMTKWIGYEWKKDPINASEVVQSMTISTDEVNKNDVHFYNAMDLLLKIDFVLNFASYKADESAVKAMKYAKHEFANIVAKSTKYGDRKSMWNILAKHMNVHFNITQKGIMFKFEDNKVKPPRSASWTRVLTQNDWKKLYQQNYYDFRLYSLAKYIDTVDFEYYTKIY